jgi:hypothetical protein
MGGVTGIQNKKYYSPNELMILVAPKSTLLSKTERDVKKDCDAEL